MLKRGRPKKEDAKRGQYRLRMSTEEEAMLDYIQARTGKSKADIFREALKTRYKYEEALEILDTQEFDE